MAIGKRRLPYARGAFSGFARIDPSTWSGGASVTTPSAPAATPAPPAPPVAPDIRDATYNDTINNAWRNLGNTTAGIAGQQALLRGSYGYNEDGSIDLTNPFSRAALLTRTYQQNRAGTENSYAARGQMTSGAYGRMQGANLYNYQQGQDQMQRAYLQENAALLSQLTAAQNAYGDTASGAAADALARSIQGRNAPGQPAAQPQAPRGLASNERVAKSAQDGQQWVYRLTNGQWLRVRRA